MQIMSRKTIYASLLLFFLLFSFISMSVGLTQPAVGVPCTNPSLTAAVTSPANGANMQNSTYQVSASIRADGGECLLNILNANLTIAVTGPATVQGAATVNISNDMSHGQTLSASWTVNCTGNGNVTITVTPSGSLANAQWVPTVYAAGQITPCFEEQLFPSTLNGIGVVQLSIIPASITVVHQCGGTTTNTYSNTGSESPSGAAGITYSYSTPPQILVTSINTQPQQTLVGQPVSILANIANRGDTQGNYKATLKINDEVIEVKNGSLAGNTARPVEFTVYRDKPGIYLVDINGRQANFTITGSSQPAPMDPRIIVIAVLSVLALAVIVVLIHRLATR
jgi:hypothetical protein